MRVESGGAAAATASLRQLGVHPLLLETGATTEDAALVLAHRGGASVIVGVGLHATLEEFLDRQRLRPGQHVPDQVVGRPDPGRRRLAARALLRPDPATSPPRRGVAGLVAVAAAVATTPVGQDWADDLGSAVQSVVDDVRGES